MVGVKYGNSEVRVTYSVEIRVAVVLVVVLVVILLPNFI